MAEERDQTGSSWEGMPLSEDYPGPHMENGAAPNGEAERDVPGPTDQAGKCGPNLLQMLKAAESRWTCQGRDGDGADTSWTGELVTEALKTDMVSKDTAKCLTPQVNDWLTPQAA